MKKESEDIYAIRLLRTEQIIRITEENYKKSKDIKEILAEKLKDYVDFEFEIRYYEEIGLCLHGTEQNISIRMKTVSEYIKLGEKITKHYLERFNIR